MKKRIVTFVLALLMCIIAFIGGTHINTNNHLNLNTIVDFDVTENGLMLYTNDGNGYYLEK